MRRNDKKISTETEIEEVLQQGQIVTISMLDKNTESGEIEPYLVPVNYGYANGKMYFHSAKAGRKVEIMKNNKKITGLVVADYSLHNEKGDNRACSMNAKYKSVMFEAEVELLTDPALCREAMLALLHQTKCAQMELPDNALSAVNMYCLHITRMTGKKS